MGEKPTRTPSTLQPLRLAYVEGVTPAKWMRIWGQRRDRPIELISTNDADDDQVRVLHDHRALMAFVRLPIEHEALHVIPLYEEQAVALISKDHALAALDSVTLAEIGREVVHPTHPAAQAVALVATGVGVVVLPQSVARLNSRRDVTARPVTDAPSTRIALAWLAEDPRRSTADTADIEEFIGIVRGRTARSSRGAAASEEPAPSKSPRQPGRGSQKGSSTVRTARAPKRFQPHRPKRC